MSIRAIRRGQVRRTQQQERRLHRLARRGLVAGTFAAAATALAPAAQASAATYTVNSAADDSGSPSAAGCTADPETTCTLRDAITAANGDSSADAITFDASLVNSTITLSTSGLVITTNADLTIDGGTNNVTVSGGDAVQPFSDSGSSSTLEIDHLTVSHGLTSTSGGAITASGGGTLDLEHDTIEDSKSTGTAGGGGVYSLKKLILDDTIVTGNQATAGPGGGVQIGTTAAGSTITGSRISANQATLGGGIDAHGKPPTGPYKGYSESPVAVSDTTVTGNQTTGTGNGGAGIFISGDGLKLTGSHITANDAGPGTGGGLEIASGEAVQISGNTISGNTAASGGGIEFAPEEGYEAYRPVTVDQTTVSNNQAAAGAGIHIALLGSAAPLTIEHSTVSGNNPGTATPSTGGGIDVVDNVYSPLRIVDTTISGNSAATGAGLQLGDNASMPLVGSDASSGSSGSIELDNSTVSGNTAATHGGGIYLGAYSAGSPATEQSATVTLESTIVAGDTANGAAEDLARASSSTTGGFATPFSLIQAPGSAPLVQQQTITGQDPQLGPLANNGGSTQTMLPAGTSPVIDQGHATSGFSTDQTGAARTVDTAVPNPSGGDGTDIGAVELPASSVQYTPPPAASTTTTTSTTVTNVVPPAPGFTATLRGVTLGPADKTPLLVGHQTPVTCAVRTGVLHSCVLAVRSGSTLVAAGEATSSRGASRLTATLELTGAGQAFVAHHPLGRQLWLTASGDASTASGWVRFVGEPSITVTTGSRSTTLSRGVRGELGQVAKLLTGARSATCTAYTDQEPGRAGEGRAAARADVKLTQAQAKSACSTLVSDGLRGATHHAGAGHAAAIASNRTARGRAANRRLVISFRF